MNTAMPKMTFLQLRSRHHFDIPTLAQITAVHPFIIYRMLLNEPVPRSAAALVLEVLAEGHGEHYTLEMFNINLDSAL